MRYKNTKKTKEMVENLRFFCNFAGLKGINIIKVRKWEAFSALSRQKIA
jgi:hypothetical protein